MVISTKGRNRVLIVEYKLQTTPDFSLSLEMTAKL